MSSSKTKKIPYLLFSTAGSSKEAHKIASILIKKKWAACVNIVPHVKSHFRWQGKIDRAHELLLIIKTDQRRLKNVEAVISRLHSYTTPEIIGWPIGWGSNAYLKWLAESVS